MRKPLSTTRAHKDLEVRAQLLLTKDDFKESDEEAPVAAPKIRRVKSPPAYPQPPASVRYVLLSFLLRNKSEKSTTTTKAERIGGPVSDFATSRIIPIKEKTIFSPDKSVLKTQEQAEALSSTIKKLQKEKKRLKEASKHIAQIKGNNEAIETYDRYKAFYKSLKPQQKGVEKI